MKIDWLNFDEAVVFYKTWRKPIRLSVQGVVQYNLEEKVVLPLNKGNKEGNVGMNMIAIKNSIMWVLSWSTELGYLEQIKESQVLHKYLKY